MHHKWSMHHIQKPSMYVSAQKNGVASYTILTNGNLQGTPLTRRASPSKRSLIAPNSHPQDFPPCTRASVARLTALSTRRGGQGNKELFPTSSASFRVLPSRVALRRIGARALPLDCTPAPCLLAISEILHFLRRLHIPRTPP